METGLIKSGSYIRYSVIREPPKLVTAGGIAVVTALEVRWCNWGWLEGNNLKRTSWGKRQQERRALAENAKRLRFLLKAVPTCRAACIRGAVLGRYLSFFWGLPLLIPQLYCSRLY